MRSQRRTRRLAVALIGSATLALTACGGGGSDDAAQPESASQEPSTPADSGADPFDLTREAADHMPMTADALATGFDAALKLPGNADSDAAGLRAQLTYLLTEHVYLAGIAVDTAYVAGADSPEWDEPSSWSWSGSSHATSSDTRITCQPCSRTVSTTLRSCSS